MNLNKNIAALAIAGGAALGMFGGTGDAMAIALTAGGTGNLSVVGSDGGVPVGLTGTVSFTSVSTSELVLGFSLQNTSFNDPAISNDNRVTAFGFDIGGSTVTITTATENSADWSITFDNGGINQFQDVDVCVYSGSTCTGGGNTGLQAGQSLNIAVTLGGTFIAPLTFDNFSARFQSTGPNQQGSLKLTGTVTPPTTPVPEPATLALVGTGLLAMGFGARRRKNLAA